MRKPDLTLAQLVGLIGAGIPVLASLARVFGVFDLNDEQIGALKDTVQWAGVLAVGLFGADALIRFGRSRMLIPQTQNVTVLDPNAVANAVANSGPSAGITRPGATPVDDPSDLPPDAGGTRPPA
jgi:hypothetical protein